MLGICLLYYLTYTPKGKKMKIILSRKGFDSGYGGFASPILPDGTMLSLPIPSLQDGIKYSDLVYSNEITYQSIIKQLSNSRVKLEGKGDFSVEHLECHLDPDLRYETYNRLPEWKGIFGQAGSALSHLENNNVSKNDVFLFFGWFRKTIMENGSLKYDPKCKGFHAIYGYLQIEEIQKINTARFEQWAMYHPHVRRGKETKSADALFISSDRLSVLPEKRGYGTFDYKEKLRLTKVGYTRSRWELPNFFREYSISYHSKDSWKEGYFQSAAKGQEFVIEGDSRLEKWLISLFE